MTRAEFTPLLEQVMDNSKAQVSVANAAGVKSLRDHIYRAAAPVRVSTVKETDGTITVYLWKEECRHGLNPFDCTICSERRIYEPA